MNEIPASYYTGRVIAFMLISSGYTHNEIKEILSTAAEQVDAVPYGCDDLLAATGLSSDTITDVATKMISKVSKDKKRIENLGDTIYSRQNVYVNSDLARRSGSNPC